MVILNSLPEQGLQRDFSPQSTGAAGTLALAHIPGAALKGTPGGITLKQCLQLTPLEIAQKSAAVKAGFRFLLKMGGEIQDRGIRHIIVSILHQPVPKFMARYPSIKEREMLHRQLAAEGLLEPVEVAVEHLLPNLANPAQPPQPLISAPGSDYMSHHSYPGGLVIHTSFNLCSSLGLYDGYAKVYGIKLHRDVVIAAQILHDLAKTWVLQWQNTHNPQPEYPLAGSGAHHVLGLAESLYRGLPAEVVVAQACAHGNVGLPPEEEKIVRYLKAAAIIAGKDPVKAGLLSACGTTVARRRRIESLVTYLGDHDWIVSVPAARWTIAALRQVACADYGMTQAELNSGKFNTLRNYTFSQATMLGLYHKYISEGEAGFRSAVNELVQPAGCYRIE